MHSGQRRLTGALIAVLPLIAAWTAQAQDYPTHPVRMITDSAAGSSIDVPMRIIADGLSKVWGQQAVVVNQPGAGGAIAARAAASAIPDGYTFGHPNELAYGTNGRGRLTHLVGELLQSRGDIKLLMVPYSGGTAQVLNDMMGKRIALVFDSYSGLAGAIEAGNAVPLAVASDKRLAIFPNLPTVAETLPGYEAGGWQVLVAPLGTPEAIVKKANADLNKALADPDVQQRLAKLGRTDTPMSPEETLAFIHSEQAKWAPILTQIGVAH